MTDCDDLSEPGILLDAVGSLSSFVSSANQKGCFADDGITHFLSSQWDQIGSEDSEKGHSWTWHAITYFLSSQQDQMESEASEKGHSSTWHGITHFLSSQQDQIWSEDSEKGHSWTWCGITHKLSSQQNQIGSGDSQKGHSWTCMESLTCCQANRTRVGMRTVRRHSQTWHGITHFLSSQHDKIESEDSEKGHRWT